MNYYMKIEKIIFLLDKFTVLDSIEEGFKTRVILNGIKGINLEESNQALNEMKSKGIDLL